MRRPVMVWSNVFIIGLVALGVTTTTAKLDQLDDRTCRRVFSHVNFVNGYGQCGISDAPLPAADDAETTRRRDARPIKNGHADYTFDLNSIDKLFFKTLFKRQRQQHKEAVKGVLKLKKYELQYEMVNITMDTIFLVLKTQKNIINNVTDIKLNNQSLPLPNNTGDTSMEALFGILGNVALLSDIVYKFPDITRRIFKKQPRWNSTLQWTYEFVKKNKAIIDKSTFKIINLAMQELEVIERQPNYFNPNKANAKKSKNKKVKKEKRKREPTLT